MLNKTSASFGLVVATAAGILLSGAPAQAQGTTISDCCISHHVRLRHHSSNWNGNRTRPRIFIRIYIYNKNNNAAVARNGASQGQQSLRRRFPQDIRGRGVLAPAPLVDPRARALPVADPRSRFIPPNNQLTAPGVTSNQLAPRNAQVPTRAVDPGGNGQVSTNGVARPAAPDQGTTQGNSGNMEPNQDVSSWLAPALS